MKKLIIMLGFIAVASHSHGQGTITLRNSALTRMELLDAQTGTTVPVPTSISLNYGIFVNGSTIPLIPLGTSSTTTAGIIDAPNPYVITGADPETTVPMQVRGWSAEFGMDWQAAIAAGAYYGETDVRHIPLGQPVLGTIIWQSKTGTHPNRFHPIVISGGGLQINDITVAEGSNGVINAVFTVSLTAARSQTVSVDFSTQDGSAVAGQDYVATNGTLTFSPGETSRTISVAVTADGPPESDEQFTVVLSNPVNSFLRRGTGTCLITEASISEIRIDTAVTFHTVAGRYYAVEFSTDLANWATVNGAANVSGIGGSMTVHDRGVGCSGVRYYRTRLLTP
jgi:hypothetical protein